MLRLAHRGDHRRHPENTLAAFAAALAIPGCDGLEFDVRASADGDPILLHDATLRRVFGRSDTAAELTTTSLTAVGVPTLADVLAAVPAAAFLDVELKEDVVERTVADLAAARGDPPERTVISSFDPAVLALVAVAAPGWPTWLNTVRLDPAAVATARGVRCAGVAVEWHALGPDSVRRARVAGLDVAAWTVRRRPTAARLERLGVVAVCIEGRVLDPG
jgi:glycerophosphoryl diester phosphodiesterase